MGRKTYFRIAKRAAILVSRHAHAKQFRRMRKSLKQLRTWLGRVIREVRRKVADPDPSLTMLLSRCERLQAWLRISAWLCISDPFGSLGYNPTWDAIWRT